MKLYYFESYGRAEIIRFLAAHAKLPLEDVYVKKDETFAALKESGKLEFGQVPMLETADGKHLIQSWSVLRYLGRQHGYYPDDAEVAYKIDSTIDAVEDFLQSNNKWRFEADETRKAAAKETFLKTFLPKWIDAIEKRIASNSTQKFIVGDKITIADFALAAVTFNILLNELNPVFAEIQEVLKDSAVIDTYVASLQAELHDYLETRPKRAG